MQFTIPSTTTAVMGIPIGKLTDLERRVKALEESGGGGGGGVGYTIETPSGALYDQASGSGGINFVVTHAPIFIVADGLVYFESVGYSRSGLNITMFNPVTQFIRSFY